ncbi:MAG TPA: tetratricopeptide repeat protein [Candidatus Obscuribacterales bacterium]
MHSRTAKMRKKLHRLCAMAMAGLLACSCLPAEAFSFSIPLPIPLPIGGQVQQDPNTVAYYRFCHDGFSATMEKDYQSALNSYRQALSIRPNDANALLGYGHALLYLKRPQEAIVQLRRAISSDPNIGNAWMNLVAAYIDANQLPQAVACGEEYLRRFPRGKENANMASQIKSAQEQLDKRQEAQTSMFGPPSAIDYLALSCEHGAHRWSLSRMPLKVYMTDGRGVSQYQPAFAEAMLSAFRQWSIASGGNIAFQQVQDANAADITVEWTGDVSHLLKRIELGQATCDRMDGDCIGHATIIMLTKNRNLHMDMTPRVIGITALHEIGHALGLEGHSDNPNDIMFYSETRATQNISMRDVTTLQRLYMLPENAVLASLTGASTFGNSLLPAAQSPQVHENGFNQQQMQPTFQQPGQAPTPYSPGLAKQLYPQEQQEMAQMIRNARLPQNRQYEQQAQAMERLMKQARTDMGASGPDGSALQGMSYPQQQGVSYPQQQGMSYPQQQAMQLPQPVGFRPPVQQFGEQQQAPGQQQPTATLQPPDFSMQYTPQNGLSVHVSEGWSANAQPGGIAQPQQPVNPMQILNQLQQAFQAQTGQSAPSAPNMVPYPRQPAVPPGSGAFNQYVPQGMTAAPAYYAPAPVGYYRQDNQIQQ